ncbi:hypothetical protein [Streptomyces fragilis]|uniref:CD-NTase-associated protein 16 NUDIX domain-containing protein n=1 Tax=Streptomyces fragilis TaxID=67301 RepID=A0ABV2YMF0_9ACTN|nr:hypothetical protein [Streptomyces fragilis]
MSRLLVYAVLFMASLAATFSYNGKAVGSIASGAVISLIIPLLDSIVANRLNLRHLWYSVRYGNQDVRISAAYLFRIKIDGKYLLIKGRRFSQLQPVGGVYKVSESGKHFLVSIGAQDDSLIPIDTASSDDLRVRFKGSKIPRFYSWFDSRAGREDSPWREFHEELIGPGILPAEVFPFTFQDYVRRDVAKIRFSEHAQSWEILIADIYELLPTADQEIHLRRLIETPHADIAWVSADSIRRRGVLPDGTTLPVAAHSQKLL